MSLNKVDFLNFFTKTVLLNFASTLGVTARKSWKKDKIISAFDDCTVNDIAAHCTEQQLQQFLEHHDQTIDGSRTIQGQVLQVLGATEATPQSSSGNDYLPTLPTHCGHMNPEGAQFCSTCGKALPQDDEVYLKYWAHKWWKDYVEGAFEDFEDYYGDVYELMSDAGFGYAANDLKTLEWITFQEGQFVEFDDEGGVYVFVAHKIGSNQRDYDSTQSEGYDYALLKDGFGSIGPCPEELQALMCRTIERDTHFAPYIKLSINQELLAAVNAEWRTLSKEEFTKKLCSAVVYEKGYV